MATTATNTVIGYFRTRAQAERTIEELRNAGFRSEQLGIAAHSDAIGTTETGTAAPTTSGHTSTAGQKAESMWDKIVHFFGGSTDDEQGYNSDEFRGSLEYAGVTRDRARYFEYQLGQSDSGALVTVSATGRENEAERIIERNGGDLGRNASTFHYPAASAQTAGTQNTGNQRRRMQLLGEVLRVHKERIPAGEVRVRKEVVTETQNVQVPVSREELVVERHPGQGTAAGQIGQDADIRIPLSEERATVQKQPVVREEVEVGKRSVEQTQNVSEQVRREELHVDKDGKAKVTEEAPKVRKRGA
jgi:uncharacterized protein (TIGR02271 family)